jgi:hypothetical protein
MVSGLRKYFGAQGTQLPLSENGSVEVAYHTQAGRLEARFIARASGHPARPRAERSYSHVPFIGYIQPGQPDARPVLA